MVEEKKMMVGVGVELVVEDDDDGAEGGRWKGGEDVQK